jgi:hypothetical protein
VPSLVVVVATRWSGHVGAATARLALFDDVAPEADQPAQCPIFSGPPPPRSSSVVVERRSTMSDQTRKPGRPVRLSRVRHSLPPPPWRPTGRQGSSCLRGRIVAPIPSLSNTRWPPPSPGSDSHGTNDASSMRQRSAGRGPNGPAFHREARSLSPRNLSSDHGRGALIRLPSLQGEHRSLFSSQAAVVWVVGVCA